MMQTRNTPNLFWHKTHGIIGYFFIVVFLGTGVYMRATLPPPEQDDMGQRMSRRAIHVYILLSALLNVVASRVGANTQSIQRSAREPDQSVPRPSMSGRLAQTGSSLLLLAPPIFLIAFFVIPASGERAKTLAIIGAFAALFGSILIERTHRYRRVSV